ncbi:PspC domain-containing protein [Aeromicrobium sp. CF4.19]|uniref:PspC domain-containing protein n=1 Tax=Aeromicrobium sp. CF4.19 TaxID=3373082 RepID=UPI003EE4E864
MNQTEPGPTTGPDDAPGDGFDAARVRTVGEMRRSKDDRLIAGVCGGAGRHLNIDPIIVRVVLAVLCLAGLAGLIIYVAAWLLLPSDDAERSLTAEWFDIGPSEPQVRTTGLFVAGLLALLAVIGDTSWGFTFWPLWVLAWLGLPVVGLYWLLVVRPRKARRQQAGAVPTSPAHPSTTQPWTTQPQAEQSTWTPSDGTTTLQAPAAGPGHGADTPATGWPPPAEPPGPGPYAPPPAPGPPRQRRPFSWALTLLTVSITAITMAGLFLWAEQGEALRWTVYVAVALGLTAAGLLVGTVVGNAGPLIPVGLVLTFALLVGALLPSLHAGDPRWEPRSAAAVESEYSLGMGRLTLDLTDVRDPSALEGRTVDLRHGMGETVVIVPEELEVELDARMTAGAVAFLDRRWSGTGLDIEQRSDATAPVLTLEMEQSMGQIRVVRR